MKISDLPAKQTNRYLKDLQRFEPQRQLLIKVGGGLLADEAAVLELVEALAELTKHDIHVVLVHGGGTQLTKAAEAQHLEARFIDGKRYTDEKVLKLAVETFTKLSDYLVKIFQDHGIDTATLSSAELFKAKRDTTHGLVGTEITSVKTDKIIEAASQHKVLVIHSLTSDAETGQTLNINADTIFRALATDLRPHRMTSLSPTGGVLQPIEGTDAHELISGIDISNIEGLIADGTVSGGMALKLRELATILEQLEIGSAISITKPAELLTELLTDQGSGTFVGKGPKIAITTDISEVFDDLAKLVERVFGQPLPLDYDKQGFEKIYYTTDLKAFGVVTKLADGTPYLDKLVVAASLQGRGVGENLWYHVTADFPQLLWRSHVTNRYATWYHRHADVMKRHGEWILFGRGADFDLLESHADEITALPTLRS